MEQPSVRTIAGAGRRWGVAARRASRLCVLSVAWCTLLATGHMGSTPLAARALMAQPPVSALGGTLDITDTLTRHLPPDASHTTQSLDEQFSRADHFLLVPGSSRPACPQAEGCTQFTFDAFWTMTEQDSSRITGRACTASSDAVHMNTTTIVAQGSSRMSQVTITFGAWLGAPAPATALTYRFIAGRAFFDSRAGQAAGTKTVTLTHCDGHVTSSTEQTTESEAGNACGASGALACQGIADPRRPTQLSGQATQHIADAGTHLLLVRWDLHPPACGLRAPAAAGQTTPGAEAPGAPWGRTADRFLEQRAAEATLPARQAQGYATCWIGTISATKVAQSPKPVLVLDKTPVYALRLACRSTLTFNKDGTVRATEQYDQWHNSVVAYAAGVGQLTQEKITSGGPRTLTTYGELSVWKTGNAWSLSARDFPVPVQVYRSTYYVEGGRLRPTGQPTLIEQRTANCYPTNFQGALSEHRGPFIDRQSTPPAEVTISWSIQSVVR